ncbi:diguanylate cyclase/phosphodiesterase (GGDEF & EAL domains) with PAS/PAC sensor(s) [hydrothermal vent metagenome]|uniref:Diguanylate cyclase/phosphodiesterase (GGDEF & EAL domains) with PAS/PAC sensor(S) n=1 Tax=hydrothermal vent metagenome TaxID=652676 RepID=A0A1W1CLT2_9ZZZZ
MKRESSNYIQEKKHALSHFLVILSFTVGMFLFLNFSNVKMNPEYFFLKFLFVGASLFALIYYTLIISFSRALLHLRKFILISVDLAVLTLSIIILADNGIFLFPFYVLIVMESGVSFGFLYFYFTVFLAIVSWVLLLFYSPYWLAHDNIIITFIIMTFLIPLVYLKQMRKMHEEQASLHESLISTNHDANFDSLTGLANRKQYEQYMKKLLDKKGFFALLFIDLNKFKAINDTHGHDAGDEVLIEVARRLNKSLDEEDMLARLGGDEFVILTTRKKAFLSKFLHKIEENTIGRHQVRQASVLIELSIGVSVYPDDSKSETFLRKYADEAMYVAKKREGEYHIFYADL